MPFVFGHAIYHRIYFITQTTLYHLPVFSNSTVSVWELDSILLLGPMAYITFFVPIHNCISKFVRVRQRTRVQVPAQNTQNPATSFIKIECTVLLLVYFSPRYKIMVKLKMYSVWGFTHGPQLAVIIVKERFTLNIS